MIFFHTNKQQKLKHRIKKRHKAAKTLESAITKPDRLTEDLVIINKALESAQGDEVLFRQYFKEEMPASLKRALQREILDWRHLQETINLVAQVSFLPKEFQARAKPLQRVLAEIQELQTLSMEILFSPLSKYYADRLTELEARTA